MAAFVGSVALQPHAEVNAELVVPSIATSAKRDDVDTGRHSPAEGRADFAIDASPSSFSCTSCSGKLRPISGCR